MPNKSETLQMSLTSFTLGVMFYCERKKNEFYSWTKQTFFEHFYKQIFLPNCHGFYHIHTKTNKLLKLLGDCLVFHSTNSFDDILCC